VRTFPGTSPIKRTVSAWLKGFTFAWKLTRVLVVKQNRMKGELVGTHEIAGRLGLSHPESVHSWRHRYEDFPNPLRIGYVWAWSDVEAWARTAGRGTQGTRREPK